MSINYVNTLKTYWNYSLPCDVLEVSVGTLVHIYSIIKDLIIIISHSLAVIGLSS